MPEAPLFNFSSDLYSKGKSMWPRSSMDRAPSFYLGTVWVQVLPWSPMFHSNPAVQRALKTARLVKLVDTPNLNLGDLQVRPLRRAPQTQKFPPPPAQRRGTDDGGYPAKSGAGVLL